jgi:hypothetical protein
VQSGVAPVTTALAPLRDAAAVAAVTSAATGHVEKRGCQGDRPPEKDEEDERP